jgi:hypothetical protein
MLTTLLFALRLILGELSVCGGTAPTSATAPNTSAISGGIFGDERFLSRAYLPYLIDSYILIGQE